MMAGASVIGTGASLYGASKSSKAAGSAMGQQKQLAEADMAFRQQQYNRYLGLYGPIEQNLANEAQSSQPLDYDRMAAQIQQNTAGALRNETNMMGMRGIAGSGLDIGAMRGAALGQASELSEARSQGFINRRNLGLTLTGGHQIQNAAQGVMGGYQGLGNMYGNWGNMYNQAAAQGWQNFGQNLGNLGWALYNSKKKKQEPYSITGKPGEGPNLGNNWGNQMPYAPVGEPNYPPETPL